MVADKPQRIVEIASANLEPRPARRRPAAEPPTIELAQSLFQIALVIILLDALIRLRFYRARPDWLALAAGAVALGGIVYAGLKARRDRRASGADAALDGLAMLGVFALFLAFYAATGSLHPSPYNAHVRQAFAFVHGHTYIAAPKYIEHAQVGAYSYQLHPPLPAILLIPFAAIWGMGVNQTAFSMVCGALDVALAWRMLGRFPLTINARLWLTVFFGAGTIVWYETVNGSSWALSMVVAIGFTLAALDELFGPGRPLRLGMLVGLAALARYDLALDGPIYLLLEYRRRRSLKPLLLMMPGFVLAGAIYVFLNEARYHSLFDQGVFIFAGPGTHLFGLRYLPGNLYTLMFMAPSLDSRFPYIHPRFMGQALLLTSPAFVLALRPSFKRVEAAAIGIAALVAMGPSLFYFTNGFAQFGTRHYLHAFPFLLVLMAMGVRRRADQMTRIMIGLSIILIAYGVWHVRLYGFN